MTLDELAEIAAQLVARVRDESPDDNGRWLAEVCPEWGDRYQLLFVLAAAVPVNKPWLHLTAWTLLPRQEVWDGLDEVAVERACRGDRVELTPAERLAAVTKLIGRGLTSNQTAERLHLTRRTVERYKALARETSRETSEPPEVLAKVPA